MLEAFTEPWHHLAACASPEHPTALWFPDVDPGNEDRTKNGAEAKRICAGCPVIRECLVGAIERREEVGIWGGAGDSWRRPLARAYWAGPEDFERAFAAHVSRLDGTPGGRVNSNGPGATHGTAASYARGCHCRPCKAAIQDRPLRRTA